MNHPLKKVALVAILNTDNQILLYRRKNTWYEEGKLALVGGIVDEGESALQAAIREVFEETSLQIESKNLTLLTEETDDSYHVFYYLCKNWTGLPTNKEPERCTELVWHPVDNLPDDTIPVIKTIIKSYVPTR